MLKVCAKTLLVSGAALGAALCAAAEPQDRADYSEPVSEMQQLKEGILDDFHQSYGPLRYDPVLLNFYIGSDPRFAELIDRMTVYYLADPATQRAYIGEVAQGRFEGSAEDYARFLTASWLAEPRYGYYAQIESPPNIPNGQAVLGGWLGADFAGPLAQEAPCKTRWSDRATIPVLAEEFARATDMYLAWAFADSLVEAAFNPQGVQFLDGAGKSNFLRAAITRWLLSGDDTFLQQDNCALTYTNFDAWAAWSAEYAGGVDPISRRASPEEVMGRSVRAPTSSGD